MVRNIDSLGPNVNTMPYVTNGWPLGMTSAMIAELVAGAIVVLFVLHRQL